MELEDLDWKQVPEHIHVLAHKDGTVNFVANLRVNEPPCRWTFEGDECNITGHIINEGEGWPSNMWKLLERPTQPTTQASNVMPMMSINHFVAMWLEKLGYVIATEPTVAGLDVNLKTKEVFICTDFGDITGVKEVVDYINTNYEMLKISENTKRKAELEAKRLKVLQELSEIDQELGRY